MGLDINGLVKSGVALAFSLTEDIVSTVTYTSRTSAGYNPALGTVTPVEETASPEAIVQTFSTREVDGDLVRKGDKKALIKASELSTITKPGLADKVTISAVVWQIVEFELDPTGTLYTFHIRKLN